MVLGLAELESRRGVKCLRGLVPTVTYRHLPPPTVGFRASEGRGRRGVASARGLQNYCNLVQLTATWWNLVQRE